MADNYGRPRRPLIAAAYLSAAMALSACGSTLSRDVEPEGPTGGTAQRMSVGVDSMISAANPYAAQAGFEILKIGGSAIDAAIAAQMVLTLVEPQSSGIGGGAYMLHWDQGKKEILAYDGRETAPAQADRNYFHLPSGEAMSRRDAGLSGRSVGVPGVLLMLWEAHKRHGRLPWKNLFEQAIELAERGFAISPRLHGLVTRFKNIKANAASRKYFLDKRGKALWTECVVAAWGCEKYAKRGRAVFAVHTGIIAAPMFEFVALARANATFKAAHADALDAVAEGAGLALAVHDRQWRDGPADDEGHYIGLDQEEVCENKPLPGNRLSAMGWALWASWQATGDTQHRDRAIAIGRYVKHRLTLAPDGAYYWPYWLAEERVTESAPRESIASEDASHAGLTMRLGFELAEDGQVFDDTDLERVGRTVRNGIGRLGGGILVSRVTGTTELKPSYIGYASAWLRVAKADPEAAQLIVDHYLNYRPAPGPRVLAELILYASKQP